jgi:hypothetical protein
VTFAVTNKEIGPTLNWSARKLNIVVDLEITYVSNKFQTFAGKKYKVKSVALKRPLWTLSS